MKNWTETIRKYNLFYHTGCIPGLLICLMVFWVGLWIWAVLEERFLPKKKQEEPQKVDWLYYDLRNGRPIYPEDTFRLTRNPIRRDEWITKEEAQQIREQGKIWEAQMRKRENENKKNRSRPITEEDVEDIVRDAIERESDE